MRKGLYLSGLKEVEESVEEPHVSQLTNPYPRPTKELTNPLRISTRETCD